MSILMVATVIQGSVLKRVMYKYLRIDMWHVHFFSFFFLTDFFANSIETQQNIANVVIPSVKDMLNSRKH